jgi:hypothetical protein
MLHHQETIILMKHWLDSQKHSPGYILVVRATFFMIKNILFYGSITSVA